MAVATRSIRFWKIQVHHAPYFVEHFAIPASFVAVSADMSVYSELWRTDLIHGATELK